MRLAAFLLCALPACASSVLPDDARSGVDAAADSVRAPAACERVPVRVSLPGSGVRNVSLVYAAGAFRLAWYEFGTRTGDLIERVRVATLDRDGALAGEPLTLPGCPDCSEALPMLVALPEGFALLTREEPASPTLARTFDARGAQRAVFPLGLEHYIGARFSDPALELVALTASTERRVTLERRELEAGAALGIASPSPAGLLAVSDEVVDPPVWFGPESTVFSLLVHARGPGAASSLARPLRFAEGRGSLFVVPGGAPLASGPGALSAPVVAADGALAVLLAGTIPDSSDAALLLLHANAAGDWLAAPFVTRSARQSPPSVLATRDGFVAAWASREQRIFADRVAVAALDARGASLGLPRFFVPDGVTLVSDVEQVKLAPGADDRACGLAWTQPVNTPDNETTAALYFACPRAAQ